MFSKTFAYLMALAHILIGAAALAHSIFANSKVSMVLSAWGAFCAVAWFFMFLRATIRD